ncbi:MAG: urease accessory protein UreF, partial [Rhodospirillaceae bacterium]
MPTEPVAPAGLGPASDLHKLLAWFSPSFPVGAFAWSHGLEWAVESGLVTDRASLEAWTGTVIAQGTGRLDVNLLRAAWEAWSAQDG